MEGSGHNIFVVLFQHFFRQTGKKRNQDSKYSGPDSNRILPRHKSYLSTNLLSNCRQRFYQINFQTLAVTEKESKLILGKMINAHEYMHHNLHCCWNLIKSNWIYDRNGNGSWELDGPRKWMTKTYYIGNYYNPNLGINSYPHHC